VRLSATYQDIVEAGLGRERAFSMIMLFEQECGVKVPWVGAGRSLTTIIEKGEFRDVLDIISIAYRRLVSTVGSGRANTWRDEIQRIFREENLAYKLDEKCVVHRFIDEEFHRTASSALQGISALALNPAKDALTRGFACLTNVRQDTKGAVTAVFEACEIVAKHLVPDSQNLNAWLCKEKLLPLCVSPGANGTELKVETGVFSAMADWVNAVHYYRHGQTEPDVVAPSTELAVQLVAMGCSFTRRLAQTYEMKNPPGKA